VGLAFPARKDKEEILMRKAVILALLVAFGMGAAFVSSAWSGKDDSAIDEPTTQIDPT
jgi:hypothetical protein